MSFIKMDIASATLGKVVPVDVIMPQREKGHPKFKCLYLLHGLSDDQSIWARRTSIERYAEKYSLAVVMPDGQKSFYTDMANGDGNYYQFIAKELPETIEAMFNVSDKAEDRYIAGNSMGGFGALKTALREEGRYAALAALSPAADMKNFIYPDNTWLNWKAIFGEEFRDCDDVPYLIKNCKERPRVYIAIGLNDFLYNNVAPVRKLFEDLNYDFKYEEAPGDHCWEFWDEYIQKALQWMLG